jgi:hypothetical protein
MAIASRLARLQRAAQATTMPTSLPPPLKGWNARDPFEAMDPQDAITLDNWYPDYAGCTTREGCRQFASTDGVNPVQTLAVWRRGSQSALVAAAGKQLWNVSSGAGGAPIGSGYAADWWGWANFSGRLFLANGEDPVQIWEGPGAADAAPSGFVIDPASGFNPSYINAMNGVQVIHNRLFFWTGRDAGFWYGPLLGIQGTLSYFPFDMLVPHGGAVIGIDVLTYDAGTGIAAYTTFFLSTGEMLSYQGTDPTNPANWSLVGIYVIAAPVGPMAYPHRSVLRYGGDVYIITSSDYAKLSQLLAALLKGTMPPRSKVSGAVIDAVSKGRDLPGWQAIYWGFRRRLIFNVPRADGAFDQHVYNPALDAWCRYQGMWSYCWQVWGDRLFFGGPRGMVVEHGVGAADQVDPAVESPIRAAAQQAWNLFETPLTKRVSMVRPVVQSLGAANFSFSLGYDYNDPNVTVPVSQASTRTPWNSSPWGSPWSSPFSVETQWSTAGGDGSAISVAIAVQALQSMTWVRTDLRIEPGVAL